MVASVLGDVYFHNPRGSNNRLNEQSAERANANRLFDSQNNNRGGYNAGDQGDNAANNENQQYRMQYFQSGPFKTFQEDGELTGEGQSYLTLEWTNQHGCGGTEDTDPHKMNCNLVLQYMCQEETGSNEDDDIRNGQSTDTQNYNDIDNLEESQNTANNRENSVSNNRGLHETFKFYDNCYARERNQGLFTADQNLQTNDLDYSSAIFTRQNPNGDRRGYECPEERDYYPYWHGSPWKDMAIMVGNLSQCEYYQTESFNVQSKYECVEYFDNNGNNPRAYSRWNNEADCTENGGDWTEFHNFLEKAPELQTQTQCENQDGVDGVRYFWGRPYRELEEQCLVALDPPDCLEAPWSRDNHLGNTRGGDASRYTWTIPMFPANNVMRCAMRLRYNISTDDYDPMNTDASQNQDVETGQQSPVQQNPYVDIGADNVPLRLAINTAQYGRTFQDRSHAFLLMPRPNGIEDKQIYNLNVRGKRGNIVQVYPAVEYDFIPNDLEIEEGSLVHMQWTGSNTHNNNAPGGDGQTGDAGEGRGGTDRNNIVQTRDAIENYPLPFEEATLFTNAKIVWTPEDYEGASAEDLAINMATSGYYHCKEAATCGRNSVQNKNQVNNLLDNAPASHLGALIEPAAGEYHYMCTRNNNFSNRSEKGKMMVVQK